jgi:hypothetical protein
MKNLITAALLGLSLMTGGAYAADATAQQSKMGTCNKEAGEKKGDERKAFMKECLSAKKATQQDKMKSCNKDAEGKKGDERKAFMKECLSK